MDYFNLDDVLIFVEKEEEVRFKKQLEEKYKLKDLGLEQSSWG